MLADREQRLRPDLREILFSINAQVFKKNIAEGYPSHAAAEMLVQRVVHSCFISGVDALRGNQDRVKRQADGFSLPLEQHPSHAMHADAVEPLGNSGKQRGDAMALRRLQRMKRHGTVLSSAPAE